MEFSIEITVPYIQSTTFTYKVKADSKAEVEPIVREAVARYGYNGIPESDRIQLLDSCELDDCEPYTDYDIEVWSNDCPCEFKITPESEPLSPELLEKYKFHPCPPRKFPSEQRVPDMTFCTDDEDDDILIEFYEDEPLDEYDWRRSKWKLISRICRFNDVKNEATLVRLLGLIKSR